MITVPPQERESTLTRRRRRNRHSFVAWLRALATEVENGTYTVRDAVRVALQHFKGMGLIE
jgi:CO/xanthine dehydrogenase FAD-binding subunit